ncbi:hypothetical protein BH11PSE7_BH11PSE7_00400 [soil metagenome]
MLLSGSSRTRAGIHVANEPTRLHPFMGLRVKPALTTRYAQPVPIEHEQSYQPP